MADSSPASSKLVPGFEFLQGLVKNAGAAMPNVGQWIAPTLDPDEIQKRIEELRTVQFWLEQNARLLATTIQALEVQRMTLSTLKTMNVTVGDLGNAMKLGASADAPAPGPAPKDARSGKAAASATASAGVVDPMQWWGALTQQFTQLAVQAMKDGTADAAKSFAGAVGKQSMAAAERTLKEAASMPADAAQRAMRAASVAAASPAPPRKRKVR
jgi:hypothetical protein